VQWVKPLRKEADADVAHQRIFRKVRSKGMQIAVFPEPPLQRMLLFGLSQVVVGHEFILIVGN
jgi:hypothetical protein